MFTKSNGKTDWIRISVFIAAWVALLHMTFYFALFWIRGSAWIGEDNLIIRTIESVVLVFSLIYLGVIIVKNIRGV
jgi:hypothetical protein